MTTEKKQCPVCLDDIGEKDHCVTECGHVFCLKCILRATQENTACPMCRNVLVDDPVNTPEIDSVYVDNVYGQGVEVGYEEGLADGSFRSQEDITRDKQKAFDDGFIRGRSGAQEEIRRLRDELHLLQTKVKTPISRPSTPYMHTQEEYKNLPTTARAEGMRSSPAMAPSWIRNDPGARSASPLGLAIARAQMEIDGVFETRNTPPMAPSWIRNDPGARWSPGFQAWIPGPPRPDSDPDLDPDSDPDLD